LEGSAVFWATVKATLVLCIPFWAIAYAREVRREGECHRIKVIFEQPTDIDWAMSHPREMLERNKAEANYVRPLLRDLEY
jgi:hypothetical protein